MAHIEVRIPRTADWLQAEDRREALESEDQGSGPVEQRYISSNVGRTVCRTSCLCSNIENYVLERVGIATFMLRHFAIIHEQNGMFPALNSSDKVFIQLK